MARERELTCIVCPVGCVMHAKQEADSIEVTGNTCKRGYDYAVSEMTAPKRMVTSSVLVIGADVPLVSVKTQEAIPKEKINEVLSLIKKTKAYVPVTIGDVLIKDAAGTGIDIVATRNAEAG